eukprot:1154454-Prorocentrum_lima.AAC.1
MECPPSVTLKAYTYALALPCATSHIRNVDCQAVLAGLFARNTHHPVSYTHLTLPTICSV